MYQNTTLADIANTFNGLYGTAYCIPFIGYELTDGSPTGNYIAMRNTNYSNGVRFLYYSAASNSYIDVTKLNQLSFVNSSGVNKNYVLELYNGNGSAGESEIRLRIGGATGGYYVLNMSTAGIKYGYDDNNGNRNYYKQFT